MSTYTTEELEAVALTASLRTAAVQNVSDALGDVATAINALEANPQLFQGGLNPTLSQLKMQCESIRAALKRDFNTVYTSSYVGPPAA